MDPTTLRLPADLLEAIDDRVEAEGYSSRSEYVRIVLRSHVDETPIDDSGADIEGLEGRVQALEDRLDDLESAPDSGPEPVRDLERERVPIETPTVASGDSDADIESVIDDWRPGQHRHRREQRREAGRAALEWLRDREVASASDFKRHVEPQHSVKGQSESTWWRKTAREALERAKQSGLVEYRDGHKEWKWVG